MAFVEAKGKTVDEAIFKGLEEMGLSLDEVEIDIIHEGGKGLFGIGKNAVVHLTKKGEAAQEEKKEDAPKPQKERAARREKTAAPAPVAAAEAAAVVPGDSEPEVFLRGLFQRMSLDADCGIREEDGKTVKIEITGEDTAVLIGRRGDTLDALQYLTGLAVNKGREDYKKIMLDAENYREKRERTLEKLAKRLANTVAKTGKPVTLEPMNPYERRILHATLQNNPRVETMSEGEEPFRRVVIRRKRREN